jgi:hypothetical protein
MLPLPLPSLFAGSSTSVISRCNTAIRIVNRTAYLGSQIVVKLPPRGLLPQYLLASLNCCSHLGLREKHETGQGGRATNFSVSVLHVFPLRGACSNELFSASREHSLMQPSPHELPRVHLIPEVDGYSPVLRVKIAKRHTVRRAAEVLLKPSIIQ